jgi:lysozyme
MSQLRIPDVSRWQGTIDWDALKNSGEVDGVVIKVSGADGGACYTDGMAARNIAEARRVGLPRWFYHYKGQGVSMEDQAAYFLHAIGGLQPGEGVVTDDEDEAKVDTAETGSFADAIKNLTKLTTVAYSNLGRFQGVDLAPLRNRGIPAWVAKYGMNDGSVAGAGSAPTGLDLNIIMWQYTSAARVSGITANTVDMSLFYGDVNAFNAIGAPGAIAAPSSPPAAAPVAQGNGIYTVVSGDTLSGIGAKLGINWQTIASTNGIVAPYVIFPGRN